MILPLPLRTGYHQESNCEIETFTPDSGYRRIRRLYASQSRFVTVKWKLSDAMYGAFEDWFNLEIGAGCLSFTTRLIAGDESISDTLVKFSEELYTSEKLNDSWIISAKLEIL